MKTKNLLIMNNLFDSLLNEIIEDSKSFVTHYDDIKFSSNDDVYNITIAIPGLTKDDIKIKVKDNKLFVSYVSNSKNKIQKFVKDFQKSYYLPKDVDYNNIKAMVENGVCSIEIPKDKEKTNERLIEIV
jgi:HSP20 family protein